MQSRRTSGDMCLVERFYSCSRTKKLTAHADGRALDFASHLKNRTAKQLTGLAGNTVVVGCLSSKRFILIN